MYSLFSRTYALLLPIAALWLALLSSCRTPCAPCTVTSCKGAAKTTTKSGSSKKIARPRVMLDIQKVATGAYLSGSVRGIKWSPDGRYLTFLKVGDGGLTELWAYDIGKKTIAPLVKSAALVSTVKETDAEKAARERKRISSRGIVSYLWSPDGRKILFPLSGDLYLYTLDTARATRLTNDDKPERDPTFSPDGAFMAWVKKGELEIMEIKTKKITTLTKGATGTRFFGLAEFVAQEEMGRYRGYWWSPDSKKIAYLDVDESKVPVRKRLDVGAGGFKVTSQRYPSVATPNATVKVAVVNIRSKKSKYLKLGTYEYVPRVQWVNRAEVSVQIQSRDQRALTLLVCDAAGASCASVHKELDASWVELHNNLRFLEGGKRVIWSTEDYSKNFKSSRKSSRPVRTLVIANRTNRGGLVQPFPVPVQQGYVFHRLLAVDEANKILYFSAYGDMGRVNHLFSFAYGTLPRPYPQTYGGMDFPNLNQTGLRRVTTEYSYNNFFISPDKKFYLEDASNLQAPSRFTIRNMYGGQVAVLPQTRPMDPIVSRLPKPQVVNIPLNDKDRTFLNGLLFKPRPGVNYAVTYPAIIFVYGGPHGHMVRRRASKYNLWSQYLAERGFYVLHVDGRGGLYRDRLFAKAPHKDFGKFEVTDSEAAARYMAAMSTVDRERIGIWGWSYGGYTVLAALSATQGVFRAGFAVAPPTDWTLYDTHYTERYLGTRGKKSLPYAQSIIGTEKLRKLSAPLMVVHGMSDDNVLLINSLRIIKKMQDIKHPFEMMLYPGKAHSLWGNSTRVHLLSQLTAFFMNHLRPPLPNTP